MEQSSSFKIGFDAKRAARNNTGLGNYSRFIISETGEGLERLSRRIRELRGEELSAAEAG